MYVTNFFSRLTPVVLIFKIQQNKSLNYIFKNFIGDVN